MKVILVFGTRPEAIKLAPLIKKIKSPGSKFEVIICVTAQHRQMLDQVLKIFNITPDYDLNLMRKDQDLSDITAQSLLGLRKVFIKEHPDLVIVQGDTTTALSASLAAYYLKISIGHVEAGLRTHNKYSPFPEEKNRHLVSVLADYHFAPTAWSQTNLLNEGVDADRVWITGNTVVDALFEVINKQESISGARALEDYFSKTWSLDFGNDGRNTSSKMILVTGHRRENFGKGFENICLAVKEISQLRDDVKIVYPVHLNPNVQKPVNEILKNCSNIHLIYPLEYEQFVYLMKKSYLILSDSGGVQEEAPSLGKPVLVMRKTTERPEGIDAGVVKLVGTDKNVIVKEAISLLDNSKEYSKMSERQNPYGDGKASDRIIEILNEKMG